MWNTNFLSCQSKWSQHIILRSTFADGHNQLSATFFHNWNDKKPFTQYTYAGCCPPDWKNHGVLSLFFITEKRVFLRALLPESWLKVTLFGFYIRNLPFSLQSPFFWRPKSPFFGKRVTFFSVGLGSITIRIVKQKPMKRYNWTIASRVFHQALRVSHIWPCKVLAMCFAPSLLDIPCCLFSFCFLLTHLEGNKALFPLCFRVQYKLYLFIY